VGTVWISVGDKAKGPMTRKFLFAGDREGVRYQSVLESFRLLELFLTQSKL
jgi:nicotinamide mononucleotide (NMN) deamidase PncC